MQGNLPEDAREKLLALKPLPRRGKLKILQVINNNPSRALNAEIIAKKLGMKKISVQQSLYALEREGYIRKHGTESRGKHWWEVAQVFADQIPEAVVEPREIRRTALTIEELETLARNYSWENDSDSLRGFIKEIIDPMRSERRW